MSEILTKDGRLYRSRNLRGLLDYARKHWSSYVAAVKIEVIPGGGSLEVLYGDGAVGTDTFADFTVLCHWLRCRRSWHGAKLTVGGTECGEIGPHDPQA